MFQSTLKHSLSEIWKRLPLSQMNYIPLKGVSKPEFVFDEPAPVQLPTPPGARR